MIIREIRGFYLIHLRQTAAKTCLWLEKVV